MDTEARDLHAELNPEPRHPGQQWRKATVAAFHAGPPRTADIYEGATTVPINGVPLLECCANLTTLDAVWLVRMDDLRVIVSREA